MAVDALLEMLPGAVAEADMSAHLYRFVKIGTGPYGVAKALATNPILGVAYTNPSVVGSGISVAISGVVKVIAGATLAVGAEVGSDANGAAVAEADTGIRVLKGGDAGQVIEVLIR